jgi:hypothetical protein
VPRFPAGRGKFYEELRQGLLAFAEHTFRLDARDEKGVSYRERLEGLSRRRGERHSDLDGPPLPPATAYLWRWYVELANATVGEAVSHAEIAAWRSLTGCRIAPWELHVLTSLDLFRRRIAAET